MGHCTVADTRRNKRKSYTTAQAQAGTLNSRDARHLVNSRVSLQDSELSWCFGRAERPLRISASYKIVDFVQKYE